MMRQSRSQRGRRVVVNLAAAGVFAAAFWVWGLFQFAASIPSVVADASTPTDAVVVLTGGSRRLDEGLDLLSRGLGKKLFVSGVYQGVDVRALLQMVKRNPTGLADRIGIGTATNTTGNAAETTTWMQREGYHSLRLVTGAYHMPRSLLEFSHAMPDVKLVPHPVFPEHVKQDRWWAWPGTASLVTGEYTKYLLAWVRLSAGRVIRGGPSPAKPSPPPAADAKAKG